MGVSAWGFGLVVTRLRLFERHPFFSVFEGSAVRFPVVVWWSESLLGSVWVVPLGLPASCLVPSSVGSEVSLSSASSSFVVQALVVPSLWLVKLAARLLWPHFFLLEACGAG